MTVYDQIEAACDCFNENEISEADVDELIDMVSMATCWTLSPCETFLTSERREVIRLPECLDECDVITFEPYFQPFDVESFSFSLVEIDGINETVTPITNFTYSDVKGVFRLDVDLPNCKCEPQCGCKKEYYLVAEYTAGYDLIPDCIMPAFCEALQYIVDRRKCECECVECNYDEHTEILVENAASISNQLKVYFVNLLTEQYKRQLSMISLCDQRYSIWGLVV